MQLDLREGVLCGKRKRERKRKGRKEKEGRVMGTKKEGNTLI